MSRSPVSFAFIGIALALPVLPAVASAPQAQAQAPAYSKDKIVCRNEVATGSMVPRRICRAQGEWDQMSGANTGTIKQARDLQNLRQMQQNTRP